MIAIVPTADRQRATVKVRIGFDELDPRILPDMGVKVAFREGGPETPAVDPRVEGAGRRSGFAVPAVAVRRDNGQDVVFVVRDGIVERRAVGIGNTTDGEATIISGLTAGERVVVEGPDELRDGDEVTAVRE